MTPRALHQARIPLPLAEIDAFSRRWHLAELALFGSVLRADFSPASDIDVLISFAPEAHPSLWDLATMREELAAILGREVDLVTQGSLRNPFRRHEILSTKQVVYAA
jgi:predicted nucleotidyltransferase